MDYAVIKILMVVAAALIFLFIGGAFVIALKPKGENPLTSFSLAGILMAFAMLLFSRRGLSREQHERTTVERSCGQGI